MRESLHGDDTEEVNSALEQAREFVREILARGLRLWTRSAPRRKRLASAR